MGRQSFSCIGYGFNEQEARRNAEDEDRRENGHQEGYSGSIGSATEIHSKCIKQPVIAKKCKVERVKATGARKWETAFIARPDWHHERERYPEESKTTQGEALQAAKRLALQHGCSYVVDVEKRLVAGVKTPIKVIPAAAERGQWRFWGEARC